MRSSANLPTPNRYFGLMHSTTAISALSPSEKKRHTLGGRKLIRRPIFARFLHKRQRTVIPDEIPIEESLRSLVARLRPAPKPRATHFAPCTRMPIYWTLRVLVCRLLHASANPQPIANKIHLAEGYTRLRHPERTRIHAKQQHFLLMSPVALQIVVTRRPSVL